MNTLQINIITFLLFWGTRDYLFSSDEESCYVFSTRNNCCEFLAPDGANFQSVRQSYYFSFDTLGRSLKNALAKCGFSQISVIQKGNSSILSSALYSLYWDPTSGEAVLPSKLVNGRVNRKKNLFLTF